MGVRQDRPHSAPSSGSARFDIASLFSPGAFSHRVDGLSVVETHVSWVVLAGRFAYKVKKPVDFGFLDFTTVVGRARACGEEVRLNRRLCPDLYLGVTWIVERDGALRMGGSGRPVEPAIWMRRLPEGGMLPNLIARGVAGEGLMRRIARPLAAFHAQADTGPGVDEHGSPAAIWSNWDENFAQTAGFVGSLLSRAMLGDVRAYVERFLTERQDDLLRRVAEGRVRDGHGDLHAGSICLEGRRLHLFDCLEFTPRFRCADVAADVAFLAMDLDHLGRADLSDHFVSAYVRASGDHGLIPLLTFYKCYRAYVRGKVLGLRLVDPALPAPEQPGLIEQARSYFDLAWAYAGGLSRPSVVVVMGLPGSGKSTVARALASHLGMVQLSSDVVRKELAGIEPTQRRYEAFGRGIYGKASSRRTYAVLRRRAARHLRRGQSVVLDATFGQPAERAAVRQLALRSRARLVQLVCQVDEPTIRRRLAARPSDLRGVSDARLAIWPALRAGFTPPPGPDAVPVDTSGSIEDTTARALDAVAATPAA